MGFEKHSITFGPFRLDMCQNRLWQGTQAILLRPQALAVLRYLLSRPGQLVTQAGGQWTLHGNLRTAATSIPEALQLLITKRLEELAAVEQRVLEVASVVGQEFAVAAVAAGMQCPLACVEAICESFVQQGRFLEAVGLEEWPDGTLSGVYRFQHALYRQVTLQRLPEMRRVQAHRRIGERLGNLHAEVDCTPLHDMGSALVLS